MRTLAGSARGRVGWRADSVVSDDDAEGSLVGEADGSVCASAIAVSQAARVAASTVPVAGTPSGLQSCNASVSAGVHTPSTGPSQNPASLSVCCTAAVVATSCWTVAPP